MLEDGRNQRPVSDSEQARLIGEEFDLGAFEETTRNRRFPALTVWGTLLAFSALIGGLRVALGVDVSHAAFATKVIAIVSAGGVFAVGCLMVRSGRDRTRTTSRQFQYSGGLAQLHDGESEPRVTPWADVASVYVRFDEPDEGAPRLSSFRLCSAAGTEMSSLRWISRSKLRGTVAAISRGVAPYLVPAMIQTYDSGEPVVFGSVRVDRQAITIDRGPAKGTPLPWSDIRLIRCNHLPKRNVKATMYKINIYRAGPDVAMEFYVSDRENGIFLPHLLAYAASRNGVQIEGHEGYESSPKLNPPQSAP